MAEDKSYKDNRTKYLKELDMLKKEYESCYGDCAGDRNLHKLSLLMTLFKSSERFEKIGEDLKTRLIIDIDRDVDYEAWGNPAFWTVSKAQFFPSGSPLEYESVNLDTTYFANKLADMMPPIPNDVTDKERKNELVERSYEERKEFKKTISNLLNEKVFNGENLDYAIDKALKKLCTALQKIPQVAESKHENKMYENLYNGQKNFYSMKFGEDNLKAHLDWRKHSLYDDISEESLKNHAEEAIVELFKAKVLDGIEANITKSKKTELKKEIDFGEHDLPRGIKPYDLYACLRDIYDYKNGKYCVNKAKAGRLIFMLRKNEQKIKSYFDFDFTLKYVNSDIDKLRVNIIVPSKINDIDFNNLECRFNKEEVKNSGINFHHADGLLAIMDIMKENVTSINWFGFYCVLLEKKYIEDNMSKFCNNMNALFDVKLNKSNLNKEKNKKDVGINIENWTEENIRIQKRKTFARKFKEVIEGYEKYLLSQATQA